MNLVGLARISSNSNSGTHKSPRIIRGNLEWTSLLQLFGVLHTVATAKNVLRVCPYPSHSSQIWDLRSFEGNRCSASTWSKCSHCCVTIRTYCCATRLDWCKNGLTPKRALSPQHNKVLRDVAWRTRLKHQYTPKNTTKYEPMSFRIWEFLR
jgi:hypothetical protein